MLSDIEVLRDLRYAYDEGYLTARLSYRWCPYDAIKQEAKFNAWQEGRAQGLRDAVQFYGKENRRAG